MAKVETMFTLRRAYGTETGMTKTGLIKGTFQRLKSFTDFLALLLRLNWLLLGRFQRFH